MSSASIQRIPVIDTHTAGEPTRIVVAGGPDLGRGSLAERRALFRDRHDDFRAAVVNEPRGSDVWVGALLCEPTDPTCAAGVIFFNNVGVLNMCGHGTIGVAVALGHLQRIGAGRHRLETPVGVVAFDYDGANRVTLENVPSYRLATDVITEVEGYGPVAGDVAWGGNWFFLVGEHGQHLALDNVEQLTAFTWRIRQALERQGITGAQGGLIDHIELFGPPTRSDADSRNFVLCPGKAYDRSPCGTGTSAKLACLYADGKLVPGQVWRQESIIGSVFEGSVRLEGEQIIPQVTGTAYVNAEATLLLDSRDPFCMGIRSGGGR
jgi:4-hydroxyproline epimerase